MDRHTHRVERLAIIETGRRRRWSDDEKLRIVTESLAGPRLASATARRYGISPGQLFTWRRELRVQLERPAIAPPQMVRVAFTRFLEDGRICMTNNAAERALRGIAVGRRNWTFAGSDAGGQRAAAAYSPIETCKLNDIDPQAWLADVLARLPDHPAKKIEELLPWKWKERQLAEHQIAATVAA